MDNIGSSQLSDDDSDDPIVKEIPIFHSKKLEDSLFVFNYPQRLHSTNEMNIRKCFFKPENKDVKLEVDIDTDLPNFDEVKAQDIARQVDGDPSTRKNDKDVFFENNLADKVIYTSTEADNEPNNYAVGTFNGRELHLTTLKGILHLTPDFTCIDKGLKRKKAAENVEEEDEPEAGPSKAEQITVKFKQNDDRWQKLRENTYRSLMTKKNSEPWVECDWHEQGSTKSNLQRLQLYAENMEETGQARNLSNADYVRLLIPEEQEATMEPTLPSHVMSLHALRALPLQEQCRLLLKDAKIIPFQQLFMLLAGGKGLTSDALLKALPKIAVLVRGNWVVKSEILYPKDTFSSTNGVPAELMCRARDYVLYLFTKNQYVERKKVSSTMKIPSEEVKEIFTGISKLRHNKGWELTVPLDEDFLAKNSELVKDQNRKWDEWFIKNSDFLKSNSEKRQRRKSKSVSEEAKKIEESKRNGQIYYSSDNDSGTEKNKSPVVARKNKAAKINSNSINDLKNSL